MNTATVDEARALLGRICAAGYFPGVTGYSQGGFMAAFAGALVDIPVVVVPRAAGTQAAPVLTEWRSAERFNGLRCRASRVASRRRAPSSRSL